jgi:hypothetical protein
MPDAVFGPLVLPDQIENGVIQTLSDWLPEYLPWVERMANRTPGTLPLPRSYVATNDLTRWPENQLPSVLVMNTGLAEEPTKDGRGNYTAKWAVGLSVVVGAADREEVDSLAKLYTAAIRTVLLHKSDLHHLAEAVEWVDEGYDALPGDRKTRRQLAAGQAIFRVEVSGVAAKTAGPRAVREDPKPPYEDGPNVSATERIVQPIEDQEEPEP